MNQNELRHTWWLEIGTVSALILYPSLMFAVKGGMNGAFLLLLVASLVVLLFRPHAMAAVRWNAELTRYSLAMVALPMAIFISQGCHQHFSGHPYDAASRFLLTIPILLLLQRMPFRTVAMIQYAFPLAAITGLLMSRHIAQGRYGIATLDLIHFGDFELMLGVLSVLSSNWTGRDGTWLRILKMLGFLAGSYASIMAGSRGGWLAVPIFVLILIHYKLGKLSIRTLLVIPFALLLAGWLAMTLSQSIHQRVNETTHDLLSFNQGHQDTSIGVRLQLYRAATEIIARNPMVGVGPEGFALEMDAMQKAGQLTALAADLGKGEVHNELLSKTAALGVFGLSAMLMLYLIPLGMFIRMMRSSCAPVRHSALLGMIFVSGFMVFGLTVEVLNLTMATAFYSLTVAVLLAACFNVHHGESILPNKL